MNSKSAPVKAHDTKRPTQVTGNVAMYYVCYRLSRLGWNVLSTSRNAKGIDIVIYNQDASKAITIQVKGLSKQPDVPLGKNLNNLIGKYFILCTNVSSQEPTTYILKTNEVRELLEVNTNQKGERSYWLGKKLYALEKYKNWNRLGKP